MCTCGCVCTCVFACGYVHGVVGYTCGWVFVNVGGCVHVGVCLWVCMHMEVKVNVQCLLYPSQTHALKQGLSQTLQLPDLADGAMQ